MITIVVPQGETYDEQNNEFFMIPESEITLEHSLVSLSRWESRWKKSFLFSEKTSKEMLDYISCMGYPEEIPKEIVACFSQTDLARINDYIVDPMTATKLPNSQTKGGSREIVTAEVIYYWMISLNIPFQCEWWHLGRLVTLVNVCNLKNTPKGKMSKKELLAQNRALNASRRAQLGTNG